MTAQSAGLPEHWLAPIEDDERVTAEYVRNYAEAYAKAALTAPAADGWRPIAEAPKSVADGSRVSGIYLLGFNPDPELDFDPQACIDIIWWEPLLPNNAGGRGKWCRQAGGDAIECAPTHWMPLPAAPQAQGEGNG